MESLTKYFAALAQGAFQRNGFASAELVAQWGVIADSDAAAQARPLRINWPKGASAARMGGTLVLKAPAALALDLHYEAPRLIERVNQYLGYGAIGAIKIIKSADEPVAARQGHSPHFAKPMPPLPGFDDADLALALAHLGQNVAHRSQPKNSTPAPFSTGENRAFEPPLTSSRKTP